MSPDPTADDLACLNTWPIGSRGHQKEQQVIEVLLALCKDHGFGRIPQLAAQIEQVWRNPESIAAFEKSRKKHLAFMEQCRNSL